MLRETVGELIELAGDLVSPHRALLERARTLGRAVGVEVLEMRPGFGDGVWEVRLRLQGEDGGGAESRPPDVHEAAESGACAGALRLAPAALLAEFTSPVRGIAPFVGDGSDDIVRFIAESDPRARVPSRGGPAPGATVRVLSAEERNRMLASTIVGDALLSLVHRNVAQDESAVEGALRPARALYLTEVRRSGAGGSDDELNGLFDRAVGDLRIHLLSDS